MQTIQIIPENSNCFRMNENPYSDFDAKVYSEQKKFTQGVSLDEETVSFFFQKQNFTLSFFKSGETLLEDQQRVKNPYYIYSPLEISEMQISPTELKGFHWRLQHMDLKAYKEREAKVFDAPDAKGGINSSIVLFKILFSVYRMDWIRH